MFPDYSQFSHETRRLHRALAALAPLAQAVGVAPPLESEWFELLEHKLLPQMSSEPWLVAAVVGGTNIGKSVVFNHLAGEDASGVSPLAAGTKHPVCLVPETFADEQTLAALFEGFELRRWKSPQDPLGDSDEHRLFWRGGANVPPKLLLLDTPDIDSDAAVNWQRAEHVRQAADVLVAVLTQQKYNDAAVKRFFRKAAEADKPVVVVFNQCHLDDDRAFWPQWLHKFVSETGVDAQLVYVVPYDREAAKELSLTFHEVGRDGNQMPGHPSSLREELASLHFDAIKIRTLRGALSEVLDADRGAPAYLRQVRSASSQFSSAAAALSAGDMARVQWPPLPPRLLVEEIRAWWDERRHEWSRKIHGFYRKLGAGVTWPVRKAWQAWGTPQADPRESFQREEQAAIIRAVENLLGELERLSEVGNETLRPRLKKLLGGQVRENLLARIKESHADLPQLDDDYRQFLREQLDEWSGSNPRVVSFLRSLDHAAAFARPAVTVVLFFSGLHVAGELVQDAAVQAAGHTMGQVATEAAITGGITGGGEALVTTTGEGLKHAAAQLFIRLQDHYARRRAAWLAGWLESELLGELLAELRRGAQASESQQFQEVEAALASLSGLVARGETPQPSSAGNV